MSGSPDRREAERQERLDRINRAEELRLLTATVASGLVTLDYARQRDRENLVDEAFDIASMIFERVRSWTVDGR